MKRFLTTLALALLMGAGAFAQDFHLGFKAGAAGNWIPGTTIENYEKVTTNVGFYGGLFANYFFSNNLFLQTEVLYACKGFASRTDITSEKYRSNLRYIQIPLFVGMELMNERCHAMIGPELGFCTSAEQKFGGQTGNIKELTNPFNLALGLQFVFFVTDNLGVDLKADYGLTKTAREITLGKLSFQDGGHNVSLQIGISYTFGR